MKACLNKDKKNIQIQDEIEEQQYNDNNMNCVYCDFVSTNQR
jgi:hypothetical protein